MSFSVTLRLGAPATFGNIVYEDRLLNISSDKPVSVFETFVFFSADFEIPLVFCLMFCYRLRVKSVIDCLGKCACSPLVTA